MEQAIQSAGSDTAYRDMTLYLYTNTNVYTYERSKFEKNFTLKINPHPSKRDTTKQGFLYVLCPRASAATSALHLLCDRIKSEPSKENSLILFGAAMTPNSTEQQTSEAPPKEIPVQNLKVKNSNDTNSAIASQSNETCTRAASQS